MLSNLLVLFVPLTMAALNTSAPRGEQIIKIPVANSSQAEICVIPKKFPNAIYSSKDVELEQELCSLKGAQPVALCPKLKSTNPAIEFFSIPAGLTASQVESKMCENVDSKKLAKYKGSISCSYTPSLLSYYHISRILGNVVQVPPVVIRTMNLQNHKALAVKAVEKVNPKFTLLKQIWQGVNTHLKAGASSSKKDAIFTTDFTQTYGALQLNPRSEEKYSEMFFSAKGTETRAMAFRDRSPIYALIKDKRDLKTLVGSQFNQANVQKVLQMQNVADMIVLDHMLSQADRFGNVHFSNAYFYVASEGGMLNVKRKNKMDAQEIAATGAVQVKHMMLKDNDCGVTKENMAQKAGLIKGINHISPTTYARLVRLQYDVTQEETRNFFKTETLMTDTDYNLFKTNLNEVVNTLKDACKTGRLKLDLDLDIQFGNKPADRTCG